MFQFEYAAPPSPKARRTAKRRTVLLRRLKELIAQGHTLASAASQIGYSTVTAWRWLRLEKTAGGDLSPKSRNSGRRSPLRDVLTAAIVRDVELLALHAGSARLGWQFYAETSAGCPPAIREALAANPRSLPSSLARAVRLRRLPIRLRKFRSGSFGIYFKGQRPVWIEPQAVPVSLKHPLGVSDEAVRNVEAILLNSSDVAKAWCRLDRHWPHLLGPARWKIDGRRRRVPAALLRLCSFSDRNHVALQAPSGLRAVHLPGGRLIIIEPPAVEPVANPVSVPACE